MAEWAQPRERAEWTHPRRAAKEIISYLSQVETVIEQYAQDEHSYETGGDEEDDDVGREQMMDNILEELKHQTASIMEDRQGSVVAEKMARRLTPLQLRTMLSRCRGYMLSLANNRYSSHVLQTLLSVAGQVVEAELSEDSDDEEEDEAGAGSEAAAIASDGTKKIDKMQDVVLSLVSELSGAWAELLADISGSHVGRAFLQVLGGLPILSEKRGRQSRHAHSIGTAVGPASMRGRNSHSSTSGGSSMTPLGDAKGKASKTPAVNPEAMEKWSTPYKHRVPRSFVAALEGVTSELAGLPASELQTLACGTFGCPLLVMLLRVHANLTETAAHGDDPGSLGAAGAMVLPCLEQESTAMKIVMKVLQWTDAERSAQVVYAISGEHTASHFLEAVLWLSPGEFFEELYHRCFESKLLEFCEHGVSNFLIQAALQRADDKALAEKMVESISDNASELLKARRAGVLWRAAQACVRLGLKAKTQTKLLQDIALAVQAGNTGAPPPPASSAAATDNDESVGDGDKGATAKASLSPDPTVDAFKAARAWVPALLSPRLPGEGGLDRLFLNVPGARIVQNALLFEPPVAAPVLKAVAALQEDVLAAIARDNMGSRCLLDPILEAAAGRGGQSGGKGKNKPAEDARRAMLRAFRGHLVAMACDRVAWHILLKCFRGVDMKEKRAMAEELASGGEQAWSRMSGYPSGRSVLTECMVERFSRSPHEWEDAFKNRDKRAKMLTEILAVESSSSRTDKARGGKGAAASRSSSGDNAAASGNERAVGLAPSPFNKEAAEGGDEVGKGKEKRRRQRGRGKRGKSGGSGEAATADADADAGTGGQENGDAGSGEHVLPSVADEKEATAVSKKKTKREKKGRTESATELESEGKRGDARGTTSDEVPKKKKRKRQENGSGPDQDSCGGGGKVPAGTAAEADLSFVMDAIEKSVAVTGGQAQPESKGVKKSKKKKKRGGSGGSVDATSSDGQELSLKEQETKGTVKTVDGRGIGGDSDEKGPEKDKEPVRGKDGKKKKKSKKTKGSEKPVDPTAVQVHVEVLAKENSKWDAMEAPSRRKGGQAAIVEKSTAASSSGKKRKGGFRLF
ncbi:unnamed protein product [Scytosiphon promiscuus]